MEKLAVYLPMKEAIAKGILNFSGTRPTGKRPANVYQVSSKGQTINTESNVPVLVPAPLATPTIPEAPPAQPMPLVVNPGPNPPYDVIIAKEFDKALQEHRPPRPNHLAPNPVFPCPLCQGPMTETPDITGVMITCYNTPCDIQCHENVFGHGKNSKEAYETAKEKFRG
jgi:hypothetical protein